MKTKGRIKISDKCKLYWFIKYQLVFGIGFDYSKYEWGFFFHLPFISIDIYFNRKS